MKKQLFYFAAVIIFISGVQDIMAQGNTALGDSSLYDNTTGTFNTAVGYRALRRNTSGFNNSALGAEALGANTTGNSNAAFGTFTLGRNTTGSLNTAIGRGALVSNITGDNNTASGYRALFRNTTGSNNTATGSAALYFNTSGIFNNANGDSALYSNTTGSFNTANGSGALYSNTTGIKNTASGYQALFSNTTGILNTAIGHNALGSNTTGSFNTASGLQALAFNTTGSNNTASGISALRDNTTGSNNTATGRGALLLNTTGNFNTASGFNALHRGTTASGNTTSGAYALYSAISGSGNTAYGASALYATTTGWFNTALGLNAGQSFDPSNSTFVGTGSDASAHVTNSTALGFGAFVTADNQVRLGNTSVISIGGQVEWTTLSDGRFKKNLKEDVPGLAFITKLRPVTYTLDVNSIDNKLKTKQPQLPGEAAKITTAAQPSPQEQKAKEEKAKIKYTGFVAQQVEKAAKELNYDFSGVDAPKSKEDFYGLRYAEFVVPLVKSVQELDAENKLLRKDIEELKETVAKLINDKALTVNGANNTAVNVSGAYLYPNAPNPFSGTTVIRYHLPEGTTAAQVVINNTNGQLLKTVTLNGRGDGQITLNAATLPAGSYTYSLWLGGRQVDAKQMLVK